MTKKFEKTQGDENIPLRLSPSALRRMRDTVAKVALFGEPNWPDAVAGDEAAAIRVVLGQGRNNAFTHKFDVSMMALALCACNGGNTARMVAGYVLSWPMSGRSFALATALAHATERPRKVRKSSGKSHRGSLPSSSTSASRPSATQDYVHV